MEILEDILVPIFICVVLPVAIVLIVFLSKMNEDNKRAAVLLKAIESNNGIDADKLAEAMSKRNPSAKEIASKRLLRGCIFSLGGLVGIISGILSWCAGAEFSSDSVEVPMLFGGIAVAVGISYLIVWQLTGKKDE